MLLGVSLESLRELVTLLGQVRVEAFNKHAGNVQCLIDSTEKLDPRVHPSTVQCLTRKGLLCLLRLGLHPGGVS